MVTVASTSAVRRTDSALRAAVIRVAVTCGLTLLACVVGSAVAEAATSSDVPAASTTADTLQADMSDLVNSLFSGLGGQHHGGVSAIQPPADDNGGNTAPGTAVIQWSCSGAANQRWTATQLPSGLWTLKNNHTGLLMTAASGTVGALVTQEADTGAELQEWTLS